MRVWMAAPIHEAFVRSLQCATRTNMLFDNSVLDRSIVMPAEDYPKRMLKVLHVGSGNLYGGIETVLTTLAKYRNSCPQMEQHFALCFTGRLTLELATAKVPVYHLGKVKASRPWLLANARKRFRKVLENEKFDAVICHSSWPMAMFGRTIFSAKQPLVFWMHGAPSGRHWVDRWARRNRPELMICNSHYTAQHGSNLYPGVASCVIRCPVEPSSVPNRSDVRQSIRRELGAPQEDIVIVQVSRMERWKGHLLHLEALATLRDIPGWRCWIVGGAQRPGEANYLREIILAAERLGIANRVQLLGQREDVRRLLVAADIFCQPNTGVEPFGVVFIEALAGGLPVVTTAVGGPCEIVSEDCGLLTPPGDAPAVARALQRLMIDPELRTSMGKAGRKRARELCAPETSLHELYDRLWSMTSR